MAEKKITIALHTSDKEGNPRCPLQGKTLKGCPKFQEKQRQAEKEAGVSFISLDCYTACPYR